MDETVLMNLVLKNRRMNLNSQETWNMQAPISNEFVCEICT